MIEKLKNKWTIILLQSVTKHEVPNTNNLHVVTWSGANKENYIPKEYQFWQVRKNNFYPNSDQEKKIMREAFKIFNQDDYKEHIIGGNQQQRTTIGIKYVVLDEFMKLLKEKQSVGMLLELLNILKEYKEGQCSYRNLRKLSQGKTLDDYDP